MGRGRAGDADAAVEADASNQHARKVGGVVRGGESIL